MPADTGPAVGLPPLRPAPRRRATPLAAALLCAAVALTAPSAPLAAQTTKHRTKAKSAKAAKNKSTAAKAARTTHATPRTNSAAATPPPATAVRNQTALRPDSALRGFQVDTLAEPIPETLVPRYPRELRGREARGSVVAEFVVDTTGRIEPATFQVISSDDPAFTAAVRDLIPGARFLPAINEGHLVRQIVRQAFLFDVDVLPRPGANPGARAPAAGGAGASRSGTP